MSMAEQELDIVGIYAKRAIESLRNTIANDMAEFFAAEDARFREEMYSNGCPILTEGPQRDDL